MPLSIRITYKTTENRYGQSRLWFASSTKKDFKETFHRHRINLYDVILFEKKVDGKYEEVPLDRLRGIFSEE